MDLADNNPLAYLPPLVAPSSSINLFAVGAVGDGVADDGDFMEAALLAAGRFSGLSTIELPTGKTFRTTREMTLEPGASGITISGGGTWKSEAPGYGINFSPKDDNFPAVGIQAATAGASTITTTATPKLIAGDHCFIYTGQVQNFPTAGYDLGFPNAEMNKVVSVVGNVITLELPLVKSYVQEYWPDGTKGLGDVTSTTASAFPAPLAVRKINPAIDVTLNNITIRHTGIEGFISGSQFVNLAMSNLTIDCDRSFNTINSWSGSMSNCTVRVRGANAWWFAIAYGGGRVAVSDVAVTADIMSYCHIHEGAADVSLTDVTITNAAGQAFDAAYPYVIGLRARPRDITFNTVTVTNARTDGQGLRVDAEVTGSAVSYVFSGTGGVGPGPGGTEGPGRRNESTVYTVNGVAGDPW